MSYSRIFGMRSFENIVRTARFRVPSSGSPLKIGSGAQIDASNAGRLKVAVADKASGPDAGVLIYEHIQNKSDALTTVSDSPYDVVPLGQYAQLVHGNGTKVWFKTTSDKTLYDGRVQAGDTLLATAVASITIGQGLSPNGSGKFVAETADDDSWFIVEQVNSDTGLVEARFTF